MTIMIQKKKERERFLLLTGLHPTGQTGPTTNFANTVLLEYTMYIYLHNVNSFLLKKSSLRIFFH